MIKIKPQDEKTLENLESSLPQYLRKSWEESSNLQFNQIPGINPADQQNFTSLFCPAGFELQPENEEDNEIPVKLEDDYLSNKESK